MKLTKLLLLALLLPLSIYAKDKYKILDVEDEKEDSAMVLTIKASYEAESVPDIKIRVEFSYEDASGAKYFGEATSRFYNYTIRGSEKWATYQFKADYSGLPDGKLTGYYIELIDKNSGEVEDDENWKVSCAKHEEWKAEHSSAAKLPVKQKQL